MRHVGYSSVENFKNRLVRWWKYKAYGVDGLAPLLQTYPPALVIETLKKYGASIGSGSILYSPLVIHNCSPEQGHHYSNLVIGKSCYIGRDVFLDLTCPITFEDYTTISMRTTIITHTHDGNRVPSESVIASSSGAVTIEHGAYIGTGATILEGVTIGAKAIVGAGTVVIHSIPSGVVAVGVPARVVRKNSAFLNPFLSEDRN